MKNTITKHISDVIYRAIGKQNNILLEIIRDPRRIKGNFIEELLEDNSRINDKNLSIAIKILSKANSKLNNSKREDATNLEKEIRAISKKKTEQKLSTREEEILRDKLKQFVDIFVEKAVDLCKEEPLFWDNARNSILRLW